MEAGLPKDLLWLREQFPTLTAQEVFDAWSRFRQIKLATSAGLVFLFLGVWLCVSAKEAEGLLGASMVSAATVLFGTVARFWGLSASGLAQIIRASRRTIQSPSADEKVKS